MLRLFFILTIVAMLNSCSKEEVATPDPGNTTSSICTAQRPDVEGLTSETSIKAAKLGQVDVDKNKDITAKYSVAGQPVIIIYKDNVEKHRLSGKGHSMSKLADLIKALL